MLNSPSSQPWRRALFADFAVLWPLKMAGTAIGITGFMCVYFWVMHHTPHTVTLMPLTRIDRWIGVTDWSLPAYVSLWIYVGLAPGFAKCFRDLVTYTVSITAMELIGVLVFWVYPTAVPDFGVDWLQYPALHFLKASDGAGNAFPSLHVAFAVFTAGVLLRQFQAIGAPTFLHAINLLWSAAIVYATLATRQHVFFDVVGGAVLGFATLMGWGAMDRWAPGRNLSTLPQALRS